MPYTNDKILARIRKHGPGYAFSPKDFTDIGNRGLVDVTLSQLAGTGTIRRIARGLYDFPKRNPALGGILSPDTDQAAQAIARRFSWRIVPEGTLAVNMLGLSTQVPAKIIYLSDGPTRRVKIGNQVIYFKHARPKQMCIRGQASSLVIQALRHLRAPVDAAVLQRVRDKLSLAERRQLLRDARYSADWVYQAARKIAAEDNK